MPQDTGTALFVIIFIGMVVMIMFTQYSQRRQKRNIYSHRVQRAVDKARSRSTRSTGPRTSTSRLSKKLRVDKEIQSDQVTLVTHHMAARDEFLGTVTILEGHHTGTAATRRDMRDDAVLKYWQFLGFGDRYDSRQRSANFDQNARVFHSEVQIIIAELRNQGWTVGAPAKEKEGDVYHLNR